MISFMLTIPAVVRIYVERNKNAAFIPPEIEDVGRGLGGEWLLYFGRFRVYFTSAQALRNEGRMELLQDAEDPCNQGADTPLPL